MGKPGKKYSLPKYTAGWLFEDMELREHENWYNQGKAHCEKDEFDKAISAFNKALKAEPNYADAYKNRGDAYHRKGDCAHSYASFIANYNRAITNYTEALRRGPNDADAKAMLEKAQKARGQ